MDLNIDNFHFKSSSLFDYLNRSEADLVKRKMSRREFKKGEYLFREKSYSRGVYIVRKGKVKIFTINSDGKQSIVYIYKKGDYFGYRPLIADEPHPVSAVAMDNVVISFIPQDTFRIILQSPHIASEVMKTLSREFSVWINKMTIFTHYGVKKRVALALLIFNMVYRQSDDKNRVVYISISKEDFAAFVGTARETVIRTLKMFKDEGIIKSVGTKIVILKPRTLISMLASL